MGAKPPPWTSEIYWFQEVFQAPTGAEPPHPLWKDKKNLSPPGQIPEYAPVINNYYNQLLQIIIN